MNNNIPSLVKTTCVGPLRFWLSLLLGLLIFGNAWGGAYTDCTDADHGLTLPTASCDGSLCSYATTAGTSVDENITVSGAATAALEWEFTADCPGDATNDATTTCRGMTVTRPSGPVDAGEVVTITGTATAGVDESFTLSVAEEVPPPPPDNIETCQRTYVMRVTSSGGGWGDPHITTVDGVNYDFQSAGEFIALKGDGIEVQTRQTAVSKQNVSGANAHTGIASCVSLYTAVALRVGPHQVTIQPNISGVPDPSGLQIRVDSVLRTLGPDGIDLSSCDYNDFSYACEFQRSGRIVRSADDKGIEILYANGTRVVVTPAWWANQQKWYLNVNIYDTTASEGIMGRVKDNWLPALPSGDSLGLKPSSVDERYDQLYETFADAWRVTDEGENESLFDYAPGTSTATFTIDEWPRKNASTIGCLLEGEPTAEPVDEDVAEEACKNVVDPNNRENCIFDVRETGHTGFADAYERSEQIIPGATRTTLTADKDVSTPGANVTFTANVQRAVSTIGKVTSGRVQFIRDGSKVGSPVDFDSNGDAIWSTSNLQVGTHKVEAKYLPTSGFGEQFRASSSREVSHTVSEFIPSKWGLSAHVGATVPTGNFSDDYDPGISAMLDLEYEITPNYSVVGLLGFNHFDGAGSGDSDTYWVNSSVNLKHYLIVPAPWKPWINGGVGAYFPESGSTRAGVNLGAGIGYALNPQWHLEVGADYHNVFRGKSDRRFFVPRIGAVFKF